MSNSDFVSGMEPWVREAQWVAAIDEIHEWAGTEDFRRHFLNEWTDAPVRRPHDTVDPMPYFRPRYITGMGNHSTGRAWVTVPWVDPASSPDAHRYDATRAEAEAEMAEWRALLDGAKRGRPT